jgi:hypothetical protein
MSVLPCEIINIILQFADTGTYIAYDEKYDCMVFRFIKNNQKYAKINDIYSTCKLDTYNEYDGYTQTQITYPITLKKVPSWYKSLERFENAESYMIIVIEQDEDGEIRKTHHTSSLLTFQNGNILLS